MKVKMKGWPQATALHLMVILCFLAGFLNAGPLQRTRGHTSVVSNWHQTPTFHHGYHAPTLTASNKVAAQDSHDIISSESPGKPESAVARRDADMALHNYALVCDDRVWTSMCAGIGYTCNSGGYLKYKQRDILCQDICVCIDLVPAPKPCVVNKGSSQCSVVDNMVLDATTGELIGNTSEASILPNGTLDFTKAIAKRDTELSHDHALVCFDRTLTGLCQNSAHDYYCNANGQVRHKAQAEVTCDAHCACVNISPRPCFKYVNMAVSCGIKDNTVFETVNGTVLGKLSDANVLDNGSLDFTHTNAIAKRHDYGLICQDREHTAWCGTSYQYYCTSKGALDRKGTGEHWCEENCWCINLKPSIQCFPNAALLTTCLLKGDMVYMDNGTLLGNASDAQVYPNGTLDFRKLITRDSSAASADPHQMICKSQNTQSNEVSPFGGGLLYDKNLTTFCANHGYSCVNEPARAALTLVLQPGSKDIKECDISCACPSETWKFEGTEHDSLSQPSPTPSSVTIQDLLLGCSSNNGLIKGTWSFDASLTQYCKNHGYDCATEPGPIFVLQHGRDIVKDCQAGCTCPVMPGKHVSALSLRSKTRINTEPRANDITSVPANSYNLDPFGMTCWSHGKHNESLTLHCRNEGYSCVSLTGTALRTLTHNSADIPDCTHSCRCSKPLARRASKSRRSDQGTSVGVAKSDPTSFHGYEMYCKKAIGIDLLNDCVSNHRYSCSRKGELITGGPKFRNCEDMCQCYGVINDNKRSVHVEISATEDDIPDSTAVAPPSGVPSQSSSRFALNCGNVADGPNFCQQSDLGYFCGYNMTVMRTSTVQNQGVTWCDYYCSCIFKDPVPCVNEWNIPLCREMPDGTVRDASRMQVVLAYIEDVIILPNNSILLDRGRDGGFPFVVASHGHGSGPNDTSRDPGDSTHWTDWPMNGTANAWWNRTGPVDD